ncbi:AAA family ATPase [Microbulbifer sp. S227A]|uniref:AAA family ATPase n=1 Tax=Microbulbifer sp. S227A TaxID=3415131 RepID=UPI003C7A5963
MLWSEKPETAARTSLRQCLHQLKDTLNGFGANFLTISKDSIEIDCEQIETDIDAIRDGAPKQSDFGSVVNLDRLLYGFEDLDPAFSEWLWDCRRITKATVCEALTNKLTSGATPELQLPVASLLNRIDPSIEIAARPVIEEHIRTGNVVELLRVYKRLWDALSDAWEEEPSLELQALVGQARHDLAVHLPELHGDTEPTEKRKFLCVLSLCLRPSRLCSDTAFDELKLRFVQNATTFLHDNGGRLISDPGADLCALFGLPVARESDARDALEAAIDLRYLFQNCIQSAARDAQDTMLGIGLDTGLLNLRDVEFSGAEMQVSGQVLDNARTLACQFREPAICATRQAIRRLRHLFILSEEPNPALGLPEVQVLDRAAGGAIAEADAGYQTTFIGRAPFLGILRFAWNEVCAGTSQIVSLHGAAGVGKTRLVSEFFNEISDDSDRVIAVGCNHYDRSAPFEPIHAIIRQLNSAHTEPLRDAGEMAKAIAEVIETRRTIIFVDDWQWIDQASRLVLQDVMRILDVSRVLLVIASREVSIDDGLVRASHQIHLPPFNVREVERCIEQLLRRPADMKLRRLLFDKSGGNPLFLEEICHSMARENTGEGQGFSALSASLQALLVHRIDLLAPGDAAILFAIAPHGEIVDVDLLNEVVGHEVSDASLERLCDLGILSETLTGESLRFKHGIKRDVVYNMIPRARRQALHAAYLTALRRRVEDAESTNDIVEQLALHAVEAGDHEAAADYAEQAGNKALALSSLDQAIRQYDTALEMIGRLSSSPELQDRWLSIALRWARPCVYSASVEHIPVLQRANALAEAAEDSPRLAEVSYWLGYNLLVQGRFQEAINHLVRSIALARSRGLDRLAVESMAVHGTALAAICDYSAARDLIEKAIALKDRFPAQADHAPVTSTYSSSVLAMLHAEQGQFETAISLLDAALARVEKFKHEIESSILNLGSIIYLWRGNWHKARTYAQRSRQRSERVGASYLIGTARCLFCYADWKISRKFHNINELEITANWLDAQGMRLYLSLIFGWLADVLADAGQEGNARRAAQRALAWADETGEGAGAAMARRASAGRFHCSRHRTAAPRGRRHPQLPT